MSQGYSQTSLTRTHGDQQAVGINLWLGLGCATWQRAPVAAVVKAERTAFKDPAKIEAASHKTIGSKAQPPHSLAHVAEDKAEHVAFRIQKMRCIEVRCVARPRSGCALIRAVGCKCVAPSRSTWPGC